MDVPCGLCCHVILEDKETLNRQSTHSVSSSGALSPQYPQLADITQQLLNKLGLNDGYKLTTTTFVAVNNSERVLSQFCFSVLFFFIL